MRKTLFAALLALIPCFSFAGATHTPIPTPYVDVTLADVNSAGSAITISAQSTVMPNPTQVGDYDIPLYNSTLYSTGPNSERSDYHIFRVQSSGTSIFTGTWIKTGTKRYGTYKARVYASYANFTATFTPTRTMTKTMTPNATNIVASSTPTLTFTPTSVADGWYDHLYPNKVHLRSITSTPEAADAVSRQYVTDRDNALATPAYDTANRATTLESKATEVANRAATLEGWATPIQARATTLEAKATEVANRAATLEGWATPIQARATTLEAKATEVSNRASTIEGWIPPLTMATETPVTTDLARREYVDAGVNAVSTPGYFYYTVATPVAYMMTPVSDMYAAFPPLIGTETPVTTDLTRREWVEARDNVVLTPAYRFYAAETPAYYVMTPFADMYNAFPPLIGTETPVSTDLIRREFHDAELNGVKTPAYRYDTMATVVPPVCTTVANDSTTISGILTQMTPCAAAYPLSTQVIAMATPFVDVLANQTPAIAVETAVPGVYPAATAMPAVHTQMTPLIGALPLSTEFIPIATAWPGVATKAAKADAWLGTNGTPVY